MSNDTLLKADRHQAVETEAIERLRRGGSVALVGRFASMPRLELIDIARAHGASYHAELRKHTSLVVVGQKDWTLTRAGTLPNALRVLRVWADREGVKTPVVSEERFLQELGLGEHVASVHPRYTTSTLIDLLGVSHESIRGWVRAGLLQPVETAHGVWHFDFRQATAAKTLCDLVRSGISLKRIRKSLENLRAWLPEVAQPLEQLAVLERDGQLLVRLADGDLLATDGQLHFDFETTGAAVEADEGVEPCMRICAATDAQQGDGPLSAADWFDRAVEQQTAGYLDEAVNSFREGLLTGGPHAVASFDLAGVLHALGRRAEAIERYRQAVEIDPRFGDAWNNLGTLLAEEGRRDEACRAFRRAIGVDPQDARAHYNLADTLDEMGLNQEAAPHWRAFLKQDAASRWASHARKRLALI